MNSQDILFNSEEWNRFADDRCRRLAQEIAGIEANRLLNTSVEDLVQYFAEKYRFHVPVLNMDDVFVSENEAQIDVSKDPDRWIYDRSRAFHVPGIRITVGVPFEGGTEGFFLRPSTRQHAAYRAEIRGNLLSFVIQGTNLTAENVKQNIDHQLGGISRHLGWLTNDANGFNNQLPQQARSEIEQRRQRLLDNQNLVSGLGFKLKARDESRTYTAPEVRRKITPKMPAASNATFKPEPVLPAEDYNHILSVLSNMSHVMERNPTAFAAIDEEGLRTHFLMQLNGHYEGAATGETFNYEGKTDILIRSNGKNIFIAECKFWGGPKLLVETIDQLLGYLSWRDTKAAVLVFSRNKNFGKVLGEIPPAVKAHPNYKRDGANQTEGSYQYIFGHRDDSNRELTITIMAFNVPKHESKG